VGSQRTGGRPVLKGKIVITTKEILKLIEAAEARIQNKKKKIDRSYEKPRKNTAMKSIIILKENKNEEEISEDNNDGKRN
jgi:hypothetical protein